MIGIQMLKKIAKKALGKKHHPLSDYRYSIDVVEPSQISGWAKNTKIPHHSPVIDVYSNGIIVWQAKCEQARVDLMEQEIGNFAFALIPNESALTQDCKEVKIHIDGHALPHIFPLDIKAKQRSLKSPNHQITQGTDSKFLFHVDKITNKSVIGWAKINQAHNNNKVTVALQCDGRVLASGVASSFRQDLVNNNIGDGKFAFELAFDLAEFPRNKLQADVYLDDELLVGKSISLEVDLNDIEHAKFNKEFAPELSQLKQSLNDETRRIYSSLTKQNGATPSTQDTLEFIVKSIAELNVRMSVMEKTMLKNLKK